MRFYWTLIAASKFSFKLGLSVWRHKVACRKSRRRVGLDFCPCVAIVLSSLVLCSFLLVQLYLYMIRWILLIQRLINYFINFYQLAACHVAMHLGDYPIIPVIYSTINLTTIIYSCRYKLPIQSQSPCILSLNC